MDIITLALAKKSSKSYVDNKLDAITTDMDYKGSVSSVEDLPSTATAGDIYTVSGDRYLYNGTEWEKISTGGSGGITEAVKVALLNCFSHIAWIDANGQTYYDALYDALYDVPAPTLTSISAVYTQSGTVYTTDTLDSLKSDLVVTATYSDSSSETVPSADYTLSGTLTEGTSTITVTYEEFTATFNVTVSSTRSAFEFENGYSVGVTNNVATKTSATARATTATPIPNLGYVFTSTDPTKYQVNAIDVTQYKKSGNGYPTGGKTITWGETDSASTAWVWLALKKLDGTDFTTEELANGASAVFTFTRSKFGTFADGYTTVKTSAGVWRQITAARATTAVPVKNNGYAFAVTDSSKYNILVNGLNSLAEEPYSNNISADGFRYTDIDNITNSWSNSASTDAEYVWISLKKMDDTAFTTAELANDASAVFTYTEGNS